MKRLTSNDRFIVLKTLGMTGKFGNMSNYPIIISILLCFSIQVHSQSDPFVVVKVRGTVVRNGRPVYSGEKIGSKDRIKFNDSNSFIVAIDGNRSAWILRPKPSLKMFELDPLPIALGTKPGLLLNYIQLVQFFNLNDTICLLQDKFRLVIGAKAFPMNEQSFFYIRPLWVADSITQKLTFVKDTLVIKHFDISSIENTRTFEPDNNHRFALYYYNYRTSQPMFINSFYIEEIDEDTLIREVKMIVHAYSERSQKEITQMIKTYLDLTYGKFSDYDVDIWLSQHFNLETK